MQISRIKGLTNKYRSLLAIVGLFFTINGHAQYSPSTCCTVSNKPYGMAQAGSTDGRSQFYDAGTFVRRKFANRAEALFYLSNTTIRNGYFPVFIDSAGQTWEFWFRNGVTDGDLVLKYGNPIDPSLFLLKANNLSDLPSISTAKTNLGLNNVDNTSDATKNAATVTLTNKTISGSNNTFQNIPNSALVNNSIGFTIGTSGSDFNLIGSPVPLGGSLALNFPYAGTSTSGRLTAADWNTFNNKLSNITGLITQGTNVTITGSGTIGSPYIISSTGGSGATGNADSIRHLFVDTGGVARNLYTLAFDSTNRKWILTAPGTGGGGTGTVTSVSINTANGFAGSVSNPSTVPAITLSTSVTGLLFGNGTAMAAATVNAPLTYSAGTLGIQQASTSQNGFLSSADWNTFNGKQNALSGNGYLKFSGTTASYLTPTQVTADLNLFTTSLQGLTPASGGGTTNFLRADGTWAAPTGGSGTVISFSAGTLSPLFTTNVATATTTPALTFTLSNAAAYTGFGNWTNASAAPTFSKIPYQAFATGTANYLLGYDGSGNPTQIKPDTLFWTELGQPGDSLGWIGSNGVLNFRKFRDSLSFHHVTNPDGSATFYSSATSDSGIVVGYGISINRIAINNRLLYADTTIPSGISPRHVVLDSVLNRLVHTDSANIRVRNPDFNTQQIYLDAGVVAGVFYYDNTDASTADDSVMTFVTNQGKRWKRLITTPYINVKWFGALGNGAHNDIPNITKAIAWLNNNANSPTRVLYFPSGNYVINSPIIVAKFNGTTYSQVNITLLGQANAKNSPSQYTSVITPTFNNSFAIGIQLGKGCNVENFKISGQFSFPNTLSNISVDTLTEAQWTDGSARQNTVTPYAGIAIDPFSDSTSYTSNSDLYPGLHSYCPAGLPRAGSTDINIKNCNITQFVVGIILSPSNQQNADEINMDQINIGGNKVGFAFCQSQSKDCNVTRFMAWAPVYSIFDNASYGIRHGDGAGSPNINGGNIASQVYQLGYMNGQSFRGGVYNVYAEGLFKLGSWVGQAGYIFENCDFNYATNATGIPYPDFFIFADNVEMVNCQNRFYGNVPTRMIFTGSQVKFRGGTLNAAPFVASMSCCNTSQTPTFDNVRLFYSPGGVIGRNRPTNPFNTNGVMNGLMSAVAGGTDPIYPQSNQSDIYSFKYNGSWDRTVPLGTKAITTNRTTWSGYFVSTAGDSTKIRVGDFLVTNNAKPVGQSSTVATTSMPIGFISKISNDTVYFNNLATEIKDSAYTIWAGYAVNNKDAFTGSMVSGQKYITKVITANGNSLATFFSMGERFDLPQFALGTYVTGVGNDTVYLSNVANATNPEYTWMNGFPSIEIWSPSTPETFTQSSQKLPLYGGATFHKSIATCCSFLYAAHYGDAYKSYKIINSNFFGDTVIHKIKYAPIIEDVGGMTIAKGTTAQLFNPNYTTPIIRINSDSNLNGFSHATITDGSFTRQLAYLNDITSATDTTILSTRNNVNRVRDSLLGVLVKNLGGAIGISSGAYLSRPSASNSQRFYWSTDSVFYSYDNGTWNDIRTAAGGNNSFLNIQANSLGTTQDPAKGILINNVTAAASGLQQISPALVLEGQGWKTNATAASQSVKFRMDVTPVQGAASPTGQLKLGSSINGGAYSDKITINSDAIGGIFTSAGLQMNGAGLNFSGGGTVAQQMTVGGAWTFNYSSGLASNANAWTMTHATGVYTSGTSSNLRVLGTYNPPSGTGEYNAVFITPTINQTGGANGITRGLYISPTLTSAADFRALEITTGQSILGGSLTVKSISTGSGTDSVLVENGGLIKMVAQSSLGGSNIYNADGALTANRTLSGATFSLALGTSGSKIGGLSINSNGTTISSGIYNSAGGSQLLLAASTINNAITTGGGTVSDFSAYFFRTPTVTSTNAVNYSHAATVRIENSPTMGTNSTGTNQLYALDVAAGISHFGVGNSNISAWFDGVIGVSAPPNSTILLGIGASSSSVTSMYLTPGADVTGSLLTQSGDLWYNGSNLYFVDGASSGTARDLLNGIHNYRHSIFTPTTGGTVNTIINQYNIVNPAGALATLTVNLPSSPNNNDVVYIKYTQTVSAVTYANGTVVSPLTAPVAGGLLVLTYDSGTTSWY